MHERTRLSRLTDEQRDFAEKNHGLVFEFLHRKRLPDEDFYDIAIFGYLHAVQKYCERPDLRQYSFGTIAFNQMRGAVNHYFKGLSMAKRNAAVCSLSTRHNDGLELHEQIAAPNREIYADIEARETWEAIRPFASPKELEAVELRSRGYTYQEIGKMLNQQRASIHKRIRVFRERVMQPCPA